MTDGGSDPSNDPSGATMGWPPPPPGSWGVDTGLPSEPPRPCRRRGGFVGLAVVVVLTGAIVALSFTVLGGQPDEPDQPFMPVGESIDGGSFGTIPMDEDDPFESGDFDTIPMDEEDPVRQPEEGLALYLPDDEDVASTHLLGDDDPYLEVDEATGPGQVRSFCLEDEPGAIDEGGSSTRVWTGSDSEVSVRVLDMGSVETAQQAIELRLDDAYLECAPGAIQANFAPYYGPGELADEDRTTSGDQFERRILLANAYDCDALLTWRQVEQYVVSTKVFACDPDAELALSSSDDLIDLSTDLITG